MLGVVEDQKKIAVAEVLQQALAERLATLVVRDVQRAGEVGNHRTRISQRGEGDERRPVCKVRGGFRCHVDRQAGLPDATGACERHQPDVVSEQQFTRLHDF